MILTNAISLTELYIFGTSYISQTSMIDIRLICAEQESVFREYPFEFGNILPEYGKRRLR